jgi:hypothetical protein
MMPGRNLSGKAAMSKMPAFCGNRMRPSPGCLLAPILLAALPASADTSALLVNATGQTWQIQTDHPGGTGTPIQLTLRRPGREPERIQSSQDSRPVLELAPYSELEFSHEAAPGVPVSAWFEFSTTARGHAVEGFLRFHPDPTLLGWGPDRTILYGMFYTGGLPHPYRFTQASKQKGVLECVMACEAPVRLECIIL